MNGDLGINGKSPAEARRLERLETTAATRTQVGAIHGEFRRIGVRRRDERLMISATLLDLDDLGSTLELTMGEAGKLIRILRDTRDRVDLDQRVKAVMRERSSIGGYLRRIIADILKG